MRFPRVWETISFTLLIRLDAFFSADGFVEETFLALGFAEDDFTPVLAWDDEVALGLLDAAVTFFGAAFFTTFALALTGVLFFAPATGLDDFLGAEDGLVLWALLTLLGRRDAFFLAVMTRIFAEYNFKKGWQALRHTEGILHPMVHVHKLRHPPPTSGTTNPRGMLGRYTNIFSGG